MQGGGFRIDGGGDWQQLSVNFLTEMVQKDFHGRNLWHSCRDPCGPIKIVPASSDTMGLGAYILIVRKLGHITILFYILYTIYLVSLRQSGKVLGRSPTKEGKVFIELYAFPHDFFDAHIE